MLKTRLLSIVTCLAAASFIPHAGMAQQTDMGRQRDEADDDTLKAIRAWGEKGKPYIPGAKAPGDLPQAKIPAFPGAWGGGMYSFGGRGGQVYVVTSLADSGPGTFREALQAVGPRIVIFNVSGIIRLETPVVIRAPYITIAGNTAPGDGVCIAGSVSIDTHDVVVRHMRFRGARERSDAVTGHPVGNIIIDHVSASWGRDENMSLYRHMYVPAEGGAPQKLPTVNITIQNSIFSECLGPGHEFGSTIGGHNSTFYRNLWANNTGRNPSIGMDGDFTLVNNVMFNWRHRSVDGGDHNSFYTIVGNYFKPGPVTPEGRPIAYRILKPEARRGDGPKDFGIAHVAGNIVHGYEEVTRDNWAGGVQLDEDELDPGATPQAVLAKIRSDTPFKHAPIPIITAEQAYEFVLSNAGATLPRRDAVDERISREVRSGEVTAKATAGIIRDPSEVGGYPEYKGEPYADADKDGLPDAWETKYGLNPNDPADAVIDNNGDGYAHIEDFIFGIDPTRKTDWTDLKNNVDLLAQAATQPVN